MIGIIGSGNVGANMAFFIAEKGVDNVLLYDVKEGLAQGKSLDMMEASPIRGYSTWIHSTGKPEDILNCEIAIVTAGNVRKPGMRREDLFIENKEMIEKIAQSFSRYKGVVIIVTEPVDMLTMLFLEKSGLQPRQVMGLGGCLDSTRLRFLIARELGVSMENVTALVVGRHSDSMIPLKEYCRVSGVPAESLMKEEKLEALFYETKNAGGMIVEMAQRASSFYGPSAVAADLAEAIFRDSKRIISVSHLFSGQYGIANVCLSLPAVIGATGIEKTLQPQLNTDQEKLLRQSAEEVRK